MDMWNAFENSARKNIPQAAILYDKFHVGLNIAYILKESFGQLWDYRSEAWARKFFENWKSSLKRRNLKSGRLFTHSVGR
jgi:transposase